MKIESIRNAILDLGQFLNNFIIKEYKPIGSSLLENDYLNLENIIEKSFLENPWFTLENTHQAIKVWASSLSQTNIETWLSAYDTNLTPELPKRIGVVIAGNVPLVGFHDFLCVLVSGNKYLGKLSSSDKYLLPTLAKILIKFEPGFDQLISFTENKLENFDAIIATGSNNSARYFECYFGKYPHIIRKNRNGVAVISGNEKNLTDLGADIFNYFGLGCRNVSKIYVPEGYDFKPLLKSLDAYNELRNHHKYNNNYDYNKSILLINNTAHYDTGFLLIKEDAQISSPISVLNYEYYNNIEILNKQLSQEKEFLQCIVAESDDILNRIKFGESQKPELWNYADGIDTMEFLLNLGL
ncbi:MAG: acyl-CoA reductase [Bacteroidetes bacterium]|nr:acyl-CoA reductase [Bacteroidota bacterium]